MMEGDNQTDRGKLVRAGLSAAGGAIPFIGGLLSAAAGYWSENEQDQVNKVFRQWLQMLEDELREKGKTIAEIVARLDMGDDETIERVESPEYQSLLKKAFRKWSSIDTEGKRHKVRNILANAAATRLTSDDVVGLFIDWIEQYSDFHFEVIGEIYRNQHSTRGSVWRGLGKTEVREDSAEADLYKLLFRDLGTGGVIRQYRETDYAGNYLKKPRKSSRSRAGSAPKTMVSAFDENEQHVLTDLGSQFVHYAMTEITPRIEFADLDDDSAI